MALVARQTNHVNQAEIAARQAPMWRSFHRHLLTVSRRRASAISFVLMAVMTPALLLAGPDGAWAEEELLSITGHAGEPIMLREHAGWNRDCEAVAHPALYLSEPPRHGKVCVRAENIKISSMFVGTESQCIGRLIRGVRLIYRSDAAYAGKDGLRYAAQYPSVFRAIEVQVTVAANAANSSDAVPSIIVAPVLLRQAPGPVPDCAEPVF
jgi:hypothetical protein